MLGVALVLLRILLAGLLAWNLQATIKAERSGLKREFYTNFMKVRRYRVFVVVILGFDLVLVLLLLLWWWFLSSLRRVSGNASSKRAEIQALTETRTRSSTLLTGACRERRHANPFSKTLLTAKPLANFGRHNINVGLGFKLLILDHLVGLVVKVSTLRADDTGFDSHLCYGDFCGSSHTSDLEICTPVAILPGTWHYRVCAGMGWPGNSVL